MNASVLKIVVIGLVVALLVALAGIVLIVLLTSKDVPGELWTLLVSMVTGLLGLLAPSKEVTQGQ